MSERLLWGAIVGAASGVALVALTAASASAPEEEVEAGGGGVAALLAKCTHLAADPFLRSALSEPLALFVRIDAARSAQLAEHCDVLAGLGQEALLGSTRHLLVSDALKTKRAAKSCLLNLVTRARREHASRASSLVEDFANLEEALENCVHNASQQSDVNNMRRT